MTSGAPSGPMGARPRRPLRQSRWAGVVVAVVSTVVVLALLVLVIGGSEGWPRVQALFFDFDKFRAGFPAIAAAFVTNL